MSRCLGSVIVGLCLLAAVGSPPAAASTNCAASQADGSVGFVPYLPTDAATIVRLRVRGVRYAIPENYFRYPAIGCDTEEDGLLLRVLLPTFEGWTKANDAAMGGPSDAPRAGMNVFLDALPPGMDRAFFAHAYGVDPAKTYPLWDGLEMARNKYGDDVFFQRPSGQLTLLMNCNTAEQFPYPHCQLRTSYRGVQLTITFNRKRQADWRTLLNGTVAMLDRFVEAANRVHR